MSLFEKCHQLITVKDNKLVADRDTLKKIRALKSTTGISTIAIAGPYHRGKSYMMNLLVGADMTDEKGVGFKVGRQIAGQTIGIWVMAKYEEINGEKRLILYLDSEGIDNPHMGDDRATHDSRIFTLCLLLGSIFLYNTHGLLTEQSLQHLSFITSLTEHVGSGGETTDDDDAPGSSGGAASPIDLDFPQLLWLVRDFQDWRDLDATYKGDTNRYMEDVLKLTNSQEHDNIRKGLARIFPENNRKCVVLPIPALDTGDLCNVGIEGVQKKFIDIVEKMKSDILSTIQPKRQGTKILNTKDFTILLNFCVDAMNSRIGNVNLFVPDVHAHFAMRQATEIYNREMEKIAKKFPLEKEEMEKNHKKSRETAVAYFNKNAYGPTKEDLEKELITKLDKKYGLFQDRNVEAYSQAYMGFGNLQNMMVGCFVVLLVLSLIPRAVALILLIVIGGLVIFGNVPLHKVTHMATQLVLDASKGNVKGLAIGGFGLVAVYLAYSLFY
eukprot:TRINITY_DN4389_c1_g1_i1.p1 TRINITY_DN4389_c1_g1~~TRINITY_DN4389_c1_g1_i1.p1  ORF type:complete len:497 (+),score=63.58 TRINITY_DN4389_c1_g1_i1:59-1549(+)